MNPLQDLTTLVRAATPLLVIETVHERRVIDCFNHVIAQSLRPLWRWTLTDGLVRLDLGRREAEVPPDATAALEAIRAASDAGIFTTVRFSALSRLRDEPADAVRDRPAPTLRCAHGGDRGRQGGAPGRARSAGTTSAPLATRHQGACGHSARRSGRLAARAGPTAGGDRPRG